jgi:hypothetical protein
MRMGSLQVKRPGFKTEKQNALVKNFWVSLGHLALVGQRKARIQKPHFDQFRRAPQTPM